MLRLTYRSFKARAASEIIFHPFILKEYNNRWFLIGVIGNKQQITTFALDRIINVDYDLDIPYRNEAFNGDEYYKNTIGVTVLDQKHIQRIVLKIDKSNAPYVTTKPFHTTQEIISVHEDGSITVLLQVHINFELERLILGFGDSIEVIEPTLLRKRIRKKLEAAVSKYTE